MSAFYVGIGQCGCVRASLVDDEHTTPGEIAAFARRQKSMKRTMRHVETKEGESPWTLNPECMEHQGEFLAITTPQPRTP